MKSIFIILIIVIFSFKLNAQLIVDAGPDSMLCCYYNFDNLETYRLGGNPTAKYGIEPYTFIWTTKCFGVQYPFTEGPKWIYASDILDDTTSCNPSFTNITMPDVENLTFYLKVEDANGIIQYDSVNIILSYFGFLLDYILPDTIYKGDSTQLIGNPHVVSNFTPFEYTISPSHGLTDSTDIFGWAKPDTSISYSIQVINSAGCVSEKVYYWHIEVIDTTTGINNIYNNKNVQCYMNNGNLVVNLNGTGNDPFKIIITTIDGKVIHSGNYKTRNLRLTNLGLKPKQLYLVSFQNSNQKMVYKLFNY